MCDDPSAVDFVAEECGESGGVGLVLLHDVVESCEDECGVGGDGGDLDVGEVEAGVVDGLGVALFEGLPALGDAGGDGEGEFGGVVEGEHEGVEVVVGPGDGGFVHHLVEFVGDLLVVGLLWGGGAAEGCEGECCEEEDVQSVGHVCSRGYLAGVAGGGC